MHANVVTRAATRVILAAFAMSAFAACQPKGETHIVAPPGGAAAASLDAACPNTVALFIDGGEVQCEDCAAIDQALADLATRTDADLG